MPLSWKPVVALGGLLVFCSVEAKADLGFALPRSFTLLQFHQQQEHEIGRVRVLVDGSGLPYIGFLSGKGEPIGEMYFTEEHGARIDFEALTHFLGLLSEGIVRKVYQDELEFGSACVVLQRTQFSDGRMQTNDFPGSSLRGRAYRDTRVGCAQFRPKPPSLLK